MATVNVTNTQSFISGETVTPAKLNTLGLPNVAISSIVNADVSASAAIAASKLALTGAIGSSQLATTSITGQTAIDSLANADTLLIHDDSASALRKATWSQVISAAQPTGAVLQTLQNVNASYVSVTSVIAKSDTAPTGSSGTQILSQVIRPSSSSNKVLVRFSAWVTNGTAIHSVAIICRGSTVIQATGAWGSTSERTRLDAEFLDSPNTTSDTTYSVRLGSNTGTVYLNGSTSAREYGGTSNATLTVQEIKG
jgi:hypothetical protein